MHKTTRLKYAMSHKTTRLIYATLQYPESIHTPITQKGPAVYCETLFAYFNQVDLCS